MSEQEYDTTEPVGTTDTATAAYEQPAAARRGVRVGTVVWGLVVAAVALGIMAIGNGLVFDVELAVITLVAAAGLALLVGSVLGTTRRKS